MPGFDRTGPMGQGPRTGRKEGKCASDEKNGKNEDSRPFGMGWGRRNRGRNRRSGWGFGFGRGREE